MKLDRNINGDGRGKYGLILNRVLDTFREPGTFGGGLPAEIATALSILQSHGILDWGDTPDTEFFLIRLKDCCADHALTAYALAARKFDSEYARDVANLAMRAGRRHPNCKAPD